MRYQSSRHASSSEGDRSARDASQTVALSVPEIFASEQQLEVSSGSPSPKTPLFVVGGASSVVAPVLAFSSDGHSSLPVPPSLAGQADPTILLSSLPSKLAAFLLPPPYGRLVEGSSRPSRAVDVAGPLGSRVTPPPPPSTRLERSLYASSTRMILMRSTPGILSSISD